VHAEGSLKICLFFNRGKGSPLLSAANVVAILLVVITVRHGSADTVVRAMNDFNGKCYFSGSDRS